MLLKWENKQFITESSYSVALDKLTVGIKKTVKKGISSLVGMCAIRHTGPGCSVVWILRVVYFPLKHSMLIPHTI